MQRPGHTGRKALATKESPLWQFPTSNANLLASHDETLLRDGPTTHVPENQHNSNSAFSSRASCVVNISRNVFLYSFSVSFCVLGHVRDWFQCLIDNTPKFFAGPLRSFLNEFRVVGCLSHAVRAFYFLRAPFGQYGPVAALY